MMVIIGDKTVSLSITTEVYEENKVDKEVLTCFCSDIPYHIIAEHT